MTVGLVGTKCGMTRIFTEGGVSIPVTVVQVELNRVAQIRTKSVDGYNAIQITAGAKKSSRVNKPKAGHFAKAGVEAGRGLWEFLVDENAEYKLGEVIGVDMFQQGQKVDVTGRSKGKGFQGVIKRWNFSTQDATHGNSLSHRAPGSIGQCQTPGRVFKGKKMCGHMGSERTTVQSLSIIRVDSERNLLLIKGALPGATGSDVIVKPAVKVSGGGK
ncbi:MAG: 50S ribosomal protein L3 [Candidatus Endonucleobacter sp. (ex Gigantidas childressi)]|nr:50S ribosomal protein L3 [Candidatus Endonucleobacter sp. (ex Gigantidas childressi)]